MKAEGLGVQKTDQAKYFIAFKVWNYDESSVQILEITQRGLQDTLVTYANNPKWGHPKDYDLTVTKTGEKMETKYQMVQDPKEPVTAEVKKADMDTYVNLNALFVNGDPFEPKAEDSIDPTALPF